MTDSATYQNYLEYLEHAFFDAEFALESRYAPIESRLQFVRKNCLSKMRGNLECVFPLSVKIAAAIYDQQIFTAILTRHFCSAGQPTTSDGIFNFKNWPLLFDRESLLRAIADFEYSLYRIKVQPIDVITERPFFHVLWFDSHYTIELEIPRLKSSEDINEVYFQAEKEHRVSGAIYRYLVLRNNHTSTLKILRMEPLSILTDLNKHEIELGRVYHWSETDAKVYLDRI